MLVQTERDEVARTGTTVGVLLDKRLEQGCEG
jgi:hypothetical protein